MVLSKKVEQKTTVLVPSGNEVLKAGVAQENISHIVSRLTNLYGNPAESTVRELFSNALDASLMVDKKDRQPIFIQEPNYMNRYFIIRDYGVGMSLDDVRKIYSNYGVSTKSENMKAVGSYGLGGKAPLAYTDNFTVETTKDGVTTVFRMQKFNGEIETEILSSEETNEDSGTKVTVPVEVLDLPDFKEAIDVYRKYSFKYPVNINGELNQAMQDYSPLCDFLVYKDEDTEILGNVYVRKENVADIFNSLTQESFSFSDFYVGFELGGWLYRKNYKPNIISHPMIIVSIVPGLVDFSSSREDITQNEKYKKLEERILKELETEKTFLSLFKIIRGFSGEDMKTFCKNVYTYGIEAEKDKNDDFVMQFHGNKKMLFEGPVSLLNSDCGINPFSPQEKKDENKTVDFILSLREKMEDFRSYSPKHQNRNLILSDFSFSVEKREKQKDVLRFFEEHKMMSFVDSLSYFYLKKENDTKVFFITDTSVENFRKIIRCHRAIRKDFCKPEEAIFVFSSLSLEDQKQGDVEYAKKLFGDRFKTMTSEVFLQKVTKIQKEITAQRKKEATFSQDESLDEMIEVSVLKAELFDDESFIKNSFNSIKEQKETIEIPFRALEDFDGPVFLSLPIIFSKVYMGAVNAGEPVTDSDVYLIESEDSLDTARWRFLKKIKDKLYLSSNFGGRKLKTARDLKDEREFFADFLISNIEKISDEELIGKYVSESYISNRSRVTEEFLEKIMEHIPDEEVIKKYVSFCVEDYNFKDVLGYELSLGEVRKEIERRDLDTSEAKIASKAIENFGKIVFTQNDSRLIYEVASFDCFDGDNPIVDFVCVKAAEKLVEDFAKAKSNEKK